MTALSSPPPLTRLRVLALAWPIVLAQAATALTGIVDTAVIGRFGDKTDLAAVAVAAVTFSFVYWGFGFLRMATTGLTAQATGAGRSDEANAVLLRGLLLAGGLGSVLFLLAPALKTAALSAFQAEADVELLSAAYFDARIWGAPAALMGFVVSGWLLGKGRSGALLAFQIVLNGVNAGLDAWFVADLGWGPAGVGAGTAIAEWVALGFGLILVREGFANPARLADRAKLAAMFAANRDIMIRTLALLTAFAWFVNSGARIGTAALAGNEVLLQFIAVSAFVLDAFAFVAEKEIGEAYGAGNRQRIHRALRRTSELALTAALAFVLAFYFGGGWIIRTWIADPEARDAALAFLPFCALAPLFGAPAWQLDGAFLGATRGRALRNAGIASTLLYIGADLILAPQFGNTGVWTAFLMLYVFRAGGLALYWRDLRPDQTVLRSA